MKNGVLWKAALVLLVGVIVWYFIRPRKEAIPESAAPAVRTPVPAAPAPAPPVAPPSAPEKTPAQGKVALLGEILASHNDNDPRLDTEFRNLDAAAKAALVEYYAGLPLTQANARGTVVFLLGREIRAKADLPFFRRVLEEKVREVPEDPEFPSRLLAAYPQVHAVRALGKALAASPDPALKAELRAQLERAAKSPNAEVAAHAKRALVSPAK